MEINDLSLMVKALCEAKGIDIASVVRDSQSERKFSDLLKVDGDHEAKDV